MEVKLDMKCMAEDDIKTSCLTRYQRDRNVTHKNHY